MVIFLTGIQYHCDIHFFLWRWQYTTCVCSIIHIASNYSFIYYCIHINKYFWTYNWTEMKWDREELEWMISLWLWIFALGGWGEGRWFFPDNPFPTLLDVLLRDAAWMLSGERGWSMVVLLKLLSVVLLVSCWLVLTGSAIFWCKKKGKDKKKKFRVPLIQVWPHKINILNYADPQNQHSMRTLL